MTGHVTRVLLYDEAQEILGAALAKARQLEVAASVAVLDADGHALAFGRLDGAPAATMSMAFTTTLYAKSGEAVGGVGVLGGTDDEDASIAEAGRVLFDGWSA